MSSSAVVTATVEVALDPLTAFEVFTGEIGQWWRPGPINWNDPGRAVGIRIEPGVGGRWIEVYDAATGEGFECGRIRVWEPGARLVVSYRDAGRDLDDTEVEIRFARVPAGGPSLKAARTSTGGSLTLIESHTTGGAPMHVHGGEDECFYVVEGTIVVHCGDDVFEAGP